MKAWKQTTEQPLNKRIFKDEFEDFLPQKILDFHVHLFPASAKPSNRPFSCAGHPLKCYTARQFFADCEAVYPGREVRAVFFGMPLQGWRQKVNDSYIMRTCDFRRGFPVRLFDPEHDRPEDVRNDVLAFGFVGLKPYPAYVRRVSQDKVRISDMLPDGVMAVADELCLLIILHLPRPGRLADPDNRKDIVRLCKRWPRAQVILAHVGRAYYLRNVIEGLDGLTDLPNLWFDTAMLNHWEVLAHLFKRANPRRILFGTDIPIALAPGKSVEINDQYTYITPVPWELSIDDQKGKIVFTSFLYEELRAIRRAVAEVDLDRTFVEGLFYRNGIHLLKQCMEGKAERGKHK